MRFSRRARDLHAVPAKRDQKRAVPRVLLALAVIAGIVAAAGAFTGVYSMLELKQTQDKQEVADEKAAVESRERVDQICALFEGDHKREVTQLARTYKFLTDLSPKALEAGLNDPAGIIKPVVAGLPKQEAEARIDRAPDFCDKPGEKAEKGHPERIVGLPEPDPVIPTRPKRVDVLIPKKEP